MEREIISKKELLELADISYGQLYRWKRKNLIPEEWFIRKSTFTGQETFFPKDKILDRITKIKEMKDDLSLDELAEVFSSSLGGVILKKQELLIHKVVSKTALDIYMDKFEKIDNFNFVEVFSMYVLDKLLQSGEINLEEGKSLLQTMDDNYKRFDGKGCELIFIRKMGISIFILTSISKEIYFENSTKIVTRLNLENCIEEIKIKAGAI